MSENYDNRMCPTCCKIGLTALHTKLLVSSKLTRWFPSEASIRSSQTRFRKPTKYPIVLGAPLSANGQTTEERYQTTRAMRVLHRGS